MRQLLWAAGLLTLAASCSEPGKKAPEKAVGAQPRPPAPAAAPAAVRPLTAAELPPGLPLPAGNVVEAKQWDDANGTNLLVISRTPEQYLPSGPDVSEDARHAELYARQYVGRAGAYKLLWQLRDAESNCPFDITLGVIPGSTAITDLDKNGRTETTLIYQGGCRSDVSPVGLKLILREGAANYALRGNNVVQYDSVPVSQRRPAAICCLDTVDEARVEATGDFDIYAGCYQNENDFRGAPPAFLRFARQQWRQRSAAPVVEPEEGRAGVEN